MTEKPPVPDAVRSFLDELTPGDVGASTFGDWTVLYEGFSGECLSDVEARMRLPPDDPRHAASFEDVLDEVVREFETRIGDELVEVDRLGDEEQPIVYAIGFRPPQPDDLLEI